VTYFFILAFLVVYLITRLYLTSAFQQTMGMLAGGAASTSDLAPLKGILEDAIKSRTAPELQAAMGKYNAWQFFGSQRDDPELNADVARVLVKLIVADISAGRSVDSAVEQKLKNAVTKAASDATIRARLKAENLKTGDAKLDTEIEKSVT
jgi:hypothetical protein